MNFAQTISDLNAQLATANGSITTLTGERDSLVAANVDFDTRHKADTLKIGDLTGQVTGLQGQVTTVTKERDDALATIANPEGHIAREVVNRLGAAGAPPVARVPEPDKENAGDTKPEKVTGTPQERLAASMRVKR